MKRRPKFSVEGRARNRLAQAEDERRAGTPDRADGDNRQPFDLLLKSAGFVDKDGAPIVPSAPEGIGGPVLQPQANTSPNMPAIPASPAQGADAGIERMDPAQGAPR